VTIAGNSELPNVGRMMTLYASADPTRLVPTRGCSFMVGFLAVLLVRPLMAAAGSAVIRSLVIVWVLLVGSANIRFCCPSSVRAFGLCL